MSRPRLITLAISPYNDFGRWSLDRSGVAFDEERKPLIWHAIASRRAGGKGTTPVLISDGEVVPESAEIAEWADRNGRDPGSLFPPGPGGDEVRSLVRRFGEDLGTQSRPLLWAALVDDLPLASRYWSQGLSPRQARAQPWLLRATKPAIRRGLGIKPDTPESAAARIREIFDDVAGRLDRHPHLVGDRITAADLSFAAMASPALLPPEGPPTRYPQPEELPREDVADAIRDLRAHPAGAYALRLYRDERTPSDAVRARDA
ncbi:MAG: glutathione S-transferase family protein [Solirubrobacterales bacterium]